MDDLVTKGGELILENKNVLISKTKELIDGRD